MSYASRIDRSNLKTSRIKLTNLLLELIGIIERVVAKINVLWKSESEFSMSKETCRRLFMVQPLENGFEWVQSAIKHQHHLYDRRQSSQSQHLACLTW